LAPIKRQLMQPIRQSVGRAEFGDEPRNLLATMPAAHRAFDAQHLELADQVAERSVGGHFSA